VTQQDIDNMLADRFAPLKNMERFTNDMFNRIIAFQEKDHPAWNSELDFASRIGGLPLHNLIFSNPDRDPAHYGPTVAPYYPLRRDMQKLAGYARQLSATPVVYDWYPGNGFIGSLLGREGLSVIGINDNIEKPNQIESFYDATCFRYRDRSEINGTNETCNLVLASWIPSQANPTPDIVKLQPGLIAYVYTEHLNEHTGQRQTGSDEMFDALMDEYELLDTWTVIRPKNLLHEVWPDMTPSIEETRITKVYAAKHLTLEKMDAGTEGAPYDWEKELEMATLALEAKQELRARGMSV
jgi:hypothetical protein